MSLCDEAEMRLLQFCSLVGTDTLANQSTKQHSKRGDCGIRPISSGAFTLEVESKGGYANSIYYREPGREGWVDSALAVGSSDSRSTHPVPYARVHVRTASD